MLTQDVTDRFAALDERTPFFDYNYEHFRTKHLAEDGMRTLNDHGILPGEVAPDFELLRAGGGSLRLGDLRGRPVLLHFGSFS